MIDPNNINTVRVGQLVDVVFSGTDNIPHEVGTDLRRGTINDLATYIAGVIDTTGGLAFLPIAVTDGQTLPATTANEWFLAGEGTYHQTGGYPDIVCVEKLSVIIGNGRYWILGVSIPITVDPPAAMISQAVNAGVTNYSPSEDAVRTAIDEKVFLNAVGSFNYNDSATQTTPISVISGVEAKLTNDTLGVYTDVSQAPFGVSSNWNPTTNQFDFSQLEIGDWVDLRTDILLDLIGTNTSYKLYIKMAIGSVAEWVLNIHNGERKATTEFNEVHYSGFVIGNEYTRDYPAEIYILTDAGATVKVNGWLSKILRKNINIVDIEVGDVAVNDLLDVEDTTPNDGDSLVWSVEKQLYVKGRPTVAVGASTKFYLDGTASLADNFTLSNTPSSFAETLRSISVTTALSPVFFERFVSAPLGKNTIPAGSWNFNIYASTSNDTGNNIVDFRVNKRVIVNGIVGTWTGSGATRTFTASSGTPFAGLTTTGNRLTAPLIETPNQTGWVTVVNSSTVVTVAITDIGYVNESAVSLNAIYYWLFNDNTADITGSAPTLYTKTLVRPEITGLNDTDRLVIAYFATTDQASARTITLYYGGTEHFTNFESPSNSFVVDPTVIEDSPNPVSGGGVFDAINEALPTDYAVIVYVNTNNPNTATIFDDVNPPTTNDNALKSDADNLYIGTDSSTWFYNGVSYATKSVKATSNFYIQGTSADAGNTKSSNIERYGSIKTVGGFIKDGGIGLNVLVDDGTTIPISSLGGAETTVTMGALIGSAGDATPNDTDYVATALTAGGLLKKITWTNVKAFLKTYFDTLYSAKGVRITNATTTGSYAVDWNAGDVWQLTLTGATTLTDTNLPTGTATKVIELMVKGAFSITLPAYWEATPSSGAYTGAKWNHIVVSCINGTTSSEKVIYSNEVLAT